MDVSHFIGKWRKSGAHERANFQPFIQDLCTLLDIEKPAPAEADESVNDYVFERALSGTEAASGGFIDLYKRGCFVMEAKQGSERKPRDSLALRSGGSAKTGTAVRGTAGWISAMQSAKGQAIRYTRALPADHDYPPFVIVTDIGYCIELYADFSGTGRNYTQFPDRGRFRIELGDLADESMRAWLKTVFEAPCSLDPAAATARATREIAARLAKLARALERDGHPPQKVAQFLMRCLFTMFAEDVRLLPEGKFTEMLKALRGNLDKVPRQLETLWRTMNTGGFSPYLMEDVKRFNGGLFRDVTALPLDADQLELMIEAAEADWREVEPAIFGTLLERALDAGERHKLGAHYTPRAYVDRLVLPTVIEPLRADWEAVKTEIEAHTQEGRRGDAVTAAKRFHRDMCKLRVLDPACGTGNFLYATLEHMKRLEGEVLDAIVELEGKEQYIAELEGHTVDPHQFLGLEINPRAKEIAELVLWIGYLQWHVRVRGNAPFGEPILKDFRNIECRDALLVFDKEDLLRDEQGKPVTRWDGETMKPHPVTGKPVPDENARIEVMRYIDPRAATWPKADFIVGNPPFIGGKDVRRVLGEGYFGALRKAYPKIPASADFVMYWWDHAARLVGAGNARRLGLISTNSIAQTFNRRIVEEHLKARSGIGIVFAIPDHPWVDAAYGADVRIAMTVADARERRGVRLEAVTEKRIDFGEFEPTFRVSEGIVHADLTIGADVGSAVDLKANDGLCSPGVKLHGAGFIVTEAAARRFGYGSDPDVAKIIRPYRNGRDLTGHAREAMVIDLFGLSEAEVRLRYPKIFQHVFDHVKPKRDANEGRTADANQYLRDWWLFGKTRPELRRALANLKRHIVTVETAKHRTFQFFDAEWRADNMLLCIALDDSACLAVLSSRIHGVWALAAGGTLEDRPRYNKSRCFDPFPFPDLFELPLPLLTRLRALGEQLDAHRKARQAAHPELTLTQMYNVLERLRAGGALSEKEKAIHEKALVSVLGQLHDEIDAAVAEAYGWPAGLADEAILERLVALNHERAAEELQGNIRWLRPAFQAPDAGASDAARETAEFAFVQPADEAAKKRAWPANLTHQIVLVRDLLAAADAPASPEALKAHFTRMGSKQRAQLDQVLASLVTMGAARRTPEGCYGL